MRFFLSQKFWHTLYLKRWRDRAEVMTGGSLHFKQLNNHDFGTYGVKLCFAPLRRWYPQVGQLVVWMVGRLVFAGRSVGGALNWSVGIIQVDVKIVFCSFAKVLTTELIG